SRCATRPRAEVLAGIGQTMPLRPMAGEAEWARLCLETRPCPRLRGNGRTRDEGRASRVLASAGQPTGQAGHGRWKGRQGDVRIRGIVLPPAPPAGWRARLTDVMPASLLAGSQLVVDRGV